MLIQFSVSRVYIDRGAILNFDIFLHNVNFRIQIGENSPRYN